MKSLFYILLFTASVFASDLLDQFPHTSIHDIFKADKRDFNKFEKHVNQMLQQDADNTDIKLMFAKLALYHGDAIGARSTIIGYSDDKENYRLHYLLARLYALQDQPAKATEHLHIALKTRQPFKEMLQDIQLLTEQDSIPDIEKFWMLNDPTPVSLENEYTVTAFQRIDYVLREFINNNKIDDRGKIYMRYGQPDQREKFDHYRHSSECWVYNNLAGRIVFFDFIKSIRYTSYTLVENYNMIEGNVWYAIPGESVSGLAGTTYDSGMNETFRSGADPYQSPLGAQDAESGPPSKFFFRDRKDIHQFYADISRRLEQAAVGALDISTDGAASRTNARNESTYNTQQQLLNYQALVDDQSETLPRTVIQLDQKMVKPTISYARFKHGADIRVELYYGLPYKEIATNKESILEQNFSLKDKNFDTFGMGSTELIVQPGGDPSSYIIDQQNILFPPDQESIFSLEITDRDKQFISTAMLQFDLQNFKQDTLFLSDIQISTFADTGDDSKFSKSGMFIQPYPFTHIAKKSPLYIYFEVYRLQQEKMKTRFHVTCAVISKTEQNWLEQLRGTPKASSIAFQNEYSGTLKSDAVFFQLDTSTMLAGENIIQITVTDLIANTSARVEKSIQIVN